MYQTVCYRLGRGGGEGQGRDCTWRWCRLSRPYRETDRHVLLRPRTGTEALRQERVGELRSRWLGWSTNEEVRG